MDIEDMNNIVNEILNLINQGIILSEFLDTERLLSEFDQINIQLKHGRYVLPKLYSLIKRIQKAVNASLYRNDINLLINLFSIVEGIRKKLGEQYQVRSEISSKVKNIKRLIDESSDTSNSGSASTSMDFGI